jgi:predicted RNase H-like HicB family nuclease
METAAMTEELHIAVRFEDGSLWATVEEFPGVFGTGETLRELRQSLEEGISLYLARPGQDPPAVKLDELQPDQPIVASAHLAYA